MSAQGPWLPASPFCVRERLGFARRRADDLVRVAANHPWARGEEVERELQQIVQEFFFHLVGAVELVAQVVNTAKGLGLGFEQVSVPTVCEALGQKDPVAVALRRLYVNPRREPMPADPYGDEGTIYRVYNHRGHVTHRGRDPMGFTFIPPFDVPEPPPVPIFVLDPRNRSSDFSSRTMGEDVEVMYAYVHDGCEVVLALLSK